MRVAVITGSGIDSLPEMRGASRRTVSTRFGEVRLIEGDLAGVDAVQISRHGERHERLSNHVDHRANVLALADAEVDGVLAVTVCGALDASIALGSLVVFDDLYFPSNRLPDGSLCTLHDRPGVPGRGHWIFEQPFNLQLRAALIDGARAESLTVYDGGCYGHVDGPRFNSSSEIGALRAAGVSAVSQTAGPEVVLAGEARLPYALIGYVTDYASGVTQTPTPTEELMRLLGEGAQALAAALTGAARNLASTGPALAPAGTVVSFQ